MADEVEPFRQEGLEGEAVHRGPAAVEHGKIHAPAHDEFRQHRTVGLVQIKDHVLLSLATEIDSADEWFRSLLTPSRIRSIVELVPDEWLNSTNKDPGLTRDVYIDFLTNRIAHSANFVNEANHARQSII